MLSKFLTTAALAVCTVVPIVAQERATFILNNGQRHSGALVYGREDNNIVDLRFHLATGSGELEFPMGDVAVIDIAGGSPASSEVQMLPGGSDGVMVMRSGAAIRGRLHNIIRGGMVQWVNEGGQRQNYPIDEVRRLYLNADAARSSYLRSVPSSIVGTGGSNITSSQVRVDGNQRWTDTGIDVRQGDRVQFTSAGQIEYAPGQRTTAAGTQGRSASYPVPLLGAGALIGRVGESAAFPIGAGRELVMPGDGRLFLGINDDVVDDNVGAFTVAVRRGGAANNGRRPR